MPDLVDRWEKCPDCGVPVGQKHEWGCDVSRCKKTGRQLLGCSSGKGCEPCVWTGEWPGTQECREFGWYAPVIMLDGTYKMMEDLNRLGPWTPSIRWSSEQERWVKR